jgi:uncharacterized protein
MASANSPCVKICVLDPELRICTGCGRTMAEIGGWLRLTDAERIAVKRELGPRLAALRRPKA